MLFVGKQVTVRLTNLPQVYSFKWQSQDLNHDEQRHSTHKCSLPNGAKSDYKVSLFLPEYGCLQGKPVGMNL